MKSFSSLAIALLASVVAAVPIEDSCQVIADNDPTTQPASIQPIVEGLLAVNASTSALNTEVGEFDGSPTSVDGLLGASRTLLATISSAEAVVAALPSFTSDNEFDALNLTPYVADLACNVNFTIQNVKAIKPEIVTACEGPTTLDQLQQQLAAAQALINAVVATLPNDDFGLPDLARQLSQPILDAIQDGIDFFSDQTSLPEGCATSSTTSATATATATATSTGSVTATATATATGSVTSTASATVTYGGYPAKPTDEDCDEDESSSYGATSSATKPASYSAAYPSKSAEKPSSYGASSSSTSCTEEYSATHSASSSYSASKSSASHSSASHSASYSAAYPSKSAEKPSSYAASSTSCTEEYSATHAASSSYYGGKSSSAAYPSYSASSFSSSYGGAKPSSSGGYAKPSGGYSYGSSSYGGAKPTGGAGYYPSSSSGAHGSSSYSAGGAKPTGGYSSGGGNYPAYTGAGVANVANVFGLLVAAVGVVALF